jgi:site-specific DNA-methyltransferase (adenine-specific)
LSLRLTLAGNRSTIRIGRCFSRVSPIVPNTTENHARRNGNGAALLELPAPVFHDSKHSIKIYQGDCVEILEKFPAESVDLIFADPPYFLSNNGITCHAGRMVSVNKGEWDRSRGADANHEFNRAWLAACQRVLKPNGTIWVSGTSHVIHSVGFAMQQLEFKLLNDISWVKPNPPPNLSCRYFTHATETIIWAAKDKKSRHTFNYKLMNEIAGGKQMKSVWEILPPPRDEKRFGKHPAQKPIALLRRILLAASDPGDIVLDPFMGSGSTAIAAFRLMRRIVAVEASDESIDLALTRVCAEVVQALLLITICQFDLDLWPESMDRSIAAQNFAMEAEVTVRLVRSERNFHFIGAARREVVFSVAAVDLQDAWRKFRNSSAAAIEIMFIVKAETEIYLAGEA